MKEIKRILVFELNQGIGGVQEYLMNIHENINKEKIQFDYIVYDKDTPYKEKILKLGGRIHYITSRKNNIVKNAIEIIKLFRQNPEYDVVYFNLGWVYYNIPFIICTLFNKKIISHSHGTASNTHKIHAFFHKLNRPYVRKKSNYHFACSTPAAEWLYGDKFIEENGFTMIHNAIDVENFIFNRKISTEVKRELDVENKFVLGHVGGFNGQKNHDFLIDIFYEIVKLNKDSKLVLIGKGEYEEKIRNKVKDLKLDDKVLFLGTRKDVDRILQAMDIFILPSHFEGLPFVGIEAQASGLKCILSDTITKEIDITGNVEFISLQKSSVYWANEILKYKNGYERKNEYNKIVDAGYEINTESRKIENYLYTIING